ncbi:unnamed protein product [Caenorhabditis auriculariae]|uniref:Uncharacterized protein n=1 Tax=Caenorhabditis auriculariae TaxID=2777116 RepID=A0A8S1HQG4_9PELO|nr:unnamed protein product [Caenorhabditis auriculariae]
MWCKTKEDYSEQQIMLFYVALFLLAGFLAYFIKCLIESGFFVKVQPVVLTPPKYLGQELLVYYKIHLGDYSHSKEYLRRARELLPGGATTFAIFYDDPKIVAPYSLRCAVGAVIGADGETVYEEFFTQRFDRRGYGKGVTRAVTASQANSHEILSSVVLNKKTYPALRDFIRENELDASIAAEFHSESDITIEFPLDSASEFFLKDHVETCVLTNH